MDVLVAFYQHLAGHRHGLHHATARAEDPGIQRHIARWPSRPGLVVSNPTQSQRKSGAGLPIAASEA